MPQAAIDVAVPRLRRTANQCVFTSLITNLVTNLVTNPVLGLSIIDFQDPISAVSTVSRYLNLHLRLLHYFTWSHRLSPLRTPSKRNYSGPSYELTLRTIISILSSRCAQAFGL